MSSRADASHATAAPTQPSSATVAGGLESARLRQRNSWRRYRFEVGWSSPRYVTVSFGSMRTSNAIERKPGALIST